MSALFRANIKIFTTGDGNTPAHYAAYGGHGDCFNCIVHHGINLLIQNKRGDTPMDAAKKAGCPNLMTKAGEFLSTHSSWSC